MKRQAKITGLLLTVVMPLCAQEWTTGDSLRLRRILDSPENLELNIEALKELKNNMFMETPKAWTEKSWLEFDTTLPTEPANTIPENQPRKIILTLRPYNANTKFNWDPVRETKIKVDKDTWRSNPFYKLTSYVPVRGVSPSGHDFMTIFTRDFWNRKAVRRRARTLEMLRHYSDSISVHEQSALPVCLSKEQK